MRREVYLRSKSVGDPTLEGLNLTVDAMNKKLVAAGPVPAAWHLLNNSLQWKHRRR
jgi:hypothetical protein